MISARSTGVKTTQMLYCSGYVDYISYVLCTMEVKQAARWRGIVLSETSFLAYFFVLLAYSTSALKQLLLHHCSQCHNDFAVVDRSTVEKLIRNERCNEMRYVTNLSLHFGSPTNQDSVLTNSNTILVTIYSLFTVIG